MEELGNTSKGLKDIPMYNILSVPYFHQIIKSQAENTLADLTANQFVIFPGAAKKMLANIHHERRDIGVNLRIFYDRDCEELIFKLMPRFRPEAATSFVT